MLLLCPTSRRWLAYWEESKAGIRSDGLHERKFVSIDILQLIVYIYYVCLMILYLISA